MTEKEKREKGLLYNPNLDQEIVNELRSCKTLCHEYNLTDYTDSEKRKALIQKIINKVEGNFLIEQPFWCDFGYNIQIGKDFYANHNLVILDCAQVKFGNNVFIGPNCGFYTAGHPLNVKERNAGLEYAKPITVGDNVWFGGNVVVMPGVTIGDNTIIGAGSVVTKNIPSNVIAVGNPCKVMKKNEID